MGWIRLNLMTFGGKSGIKRKQTLILERSAALCSVFWRCDFLSPLLDIFVIGNRYLIYRSKNLKESRSGRPGTESSHSVLLRVRVKVKGLWSSMDPMSSSLASVRLCSHQLGYCETVGGVNPAKHEVLFRLISAEDLARFRRLVSIKVFWSLLGCGGLVMSSRGPGSFCGSGSTYDIDDKIITNFTSYQYFCKLVLAVSKYQRPVPVPSRTSSVGDMWERQVYERCWQEIGWTPVSILRQLSEFPWTSGDLGQYSAMTLAKCYYQASWLAVETQPLVLGAADLSRFFVALKY